MIFSIGAKEKVDLDIANLWDEIVVACGMYDKHTSCCERDWHDAYDCDEDDDECCEGDCFDCEIPCDNNVFF